MASDTGIRVSNPTLKVWVWVLVVLFMCCVVLCRWRPRYESVSCARGLPKDLRIYNFRINTESGQIVEAEEHRCYEFIDGESSGAQEECSKFCDFLS
jgi:hypothetical protein